MIEIEAQAFRCNQRAFLFGVFAQCVAQRSMQQMGGGMIADNIAPPLGINLHINQVVQTDFAVGDAATMHKNGGQWFLHILDLNRAVWPDQQPGITNLAAAFGITRRSIQHQRHRLTGLHHAHFLAVHFQRQHMTPGLQLVVAGERGWRQVAFGPAFAGCAFFKLGGFTPAMALGGEFAFVARFINRNAALGQNAGG